MTPEDQLLLLLARQALQPEQQSAIRKLVTRHAIDWEALFDTAVTLGVAPLTYTLIQQHPELNLNPPSEISQRFQLYVSRQVLREIKREERLAWALDYFRAQSIRVMLIKGAALKVSVYASPWYTVAHDLDIVLDRPRADFSAVDYAQIVRLLARKGIEFDFYHHHDVTMNGVLAVDFDAIWRDAQPVTYAGGEVWLMCPEDLLIALCINSCRKRFFRLKSLCDLAETVRHYPQLNWEVLAHKARAYGCQNIVYAALTLTDQLMDCGLPVGALDRLRVGPLRAASIRACANFLMRRLSLASHVIASRTVLGRKLDWSVLLPYATYSPMHIIRKAAYVKATWSTPQRKSRA